MAGNISKHARYGQDPLRPAKRYCARSNREDTRRATLALRPFPQLSNGERGEVVGEAGDMLDFAAVDAELRDVLGEPAVA
jgi:hypothetical protein